MEPELFNDWPIEKQLEFAIKMGWEIKFKGQTGNKVEYIIEVPVKSKNAHGRISGITLEEKDPNA